MDKKVLDIICCPKCKGQLKLIDEKIEGKNVSEGFLGCVCGKRYEIKDGIPIMIIDEA